MIPLAAAKKSSASSAFIFPAMYLNSVDQSLTSVIEQKRRAVDQGPGDVLGRRQPAGGRLLDAHLQVVSQLEQDRIDGHRALGLLEQAAQRRELGINRQRGPAGGEHRLLVAPL